MLSDGDIENLQGVGVRNVDHENWVSITQAFADYTYEQSFDYTKLMAERVGASALFLTIYAGKRLIAAASARVKTFPLFGRGLAYISGGPLMQLRGHDWEPVKCQAILATLKRKLVDEDGHLLCVRLPASPPCPVEASAIFTKLGFRPTSQFRTYRTIIKDLKRDDRELRASLRKRWRRDLSFAQRAGLVIDHGSAETFCRRFLNLYAQMRELKHFDAGWNPEFLFDLPPASSGLEVLIATKNGQDAAGIVLSLLGDTTITLFSATNKLGREARAGYLMVWRAMLLAKERGLDWYDVGGVDARVNPGVYHFKAGVRGQELTAVGPYEAWPRGHLPILLRKLPTLRNWLRAH
jgi:lipid II:glycine glycyltransferase (peptidoglycan interpeptide bridge formation enzyme)